jgi:hypothetical protein
MNRFLAAVILVALGVGAAGPAMADYYGRGYRGDGWHHGYYGYHERVYIGPPVIYEPAPPPMVIYQSPPPVVVYPAPPPVYAAPVVNQPVDATATSPTFRDNSGRYCREFQSKVVVGGALRDSYGTACQQPDGSWQIVQ